MSSRQYKYFKSAALSEAENLQVCALLGDRRESMATTVAEIYTKRNPKHKPWQKEFLGILCFVKDHCARAFYFRLYCPKSGSMLWEQECYKELQYICECDFFHMFEGQDCIVGFNFTNTEDAQQFKKMVHWAFKLKSGKEKPGRRTITINDIGKPQDFQHIEHISLHTENKLDTMVNVKSPPDDVPSKIQQLKSVKPPPATRQFVDTPKLKDNKEKILERIAEIPMPPPPPPCIPILMKETGSINKENMQAASVACEETDSRSCLLESIRKGTQLKPINLCKTNDQCTKNSLSSALSKVIAERERALRNSCSSSSESLHNSDWSDD